MKKKVKDKISELFHTLPSPYKEQAIKNVQEQFPPYLEVYHSAEL